MHHLWEPGLPAMASTWPARQLADAANAPESDLASCPALGVPALE